MLLLGGRASHMIVLVCTLALLMETVRGGSSFLSPAQRPQQGKGDRKTPRVGRRDAAQPDSPQEDAHFLASPPFRLGVTMTEAEFEEHGSALQKILDNILGDKAD
ncbi:ghrelin/obestatin prepropeptide [Clupea harengus]|uniref:Ghrelin/obestatin prepropeptide n=1 Tax=Clupea harengus TaxID=7950 RepID=A0A6P8F637_CLUHA|nr:ghrelin/obestatin prepropeptide [Clupea harengus]